MKWGYAAENVPFTAVERVLNERGERGWELCAAYPIGDGNVQLFFKMPMPEYKG